jgi:serine/threonine-protein kinase RsbW
MTERRLVISARYADVAAACSFCSTAAADAGLSEHAAFHVQMAVDEACTNVITHAYGGEERGVIEITCAVRPGELIIRIHDHGHPFDPGDIPDPKLGAQIEELEVGGLGLYFMRQVMDDVRFSFSSEGNDLIMVKRSDHASH